MEFASTMGRKRQTRHERRGPRGRLVILSLSIALLAPGVSGPAWAIQSSAPDQSPSTSSSTASLPRGKKLILRDGSFQLVREYNVEGDRVRYYSIEQSQWEEIPES